MLEGSTFLINVVSRTFHMLSLPHSSLEFREQSVNTANRTERLCKFRCMGYLL